MIAVGDFCNFTLIKTPKRWFLESYMPHDEVLFDYSTEVRTLEAFVSGNQRIVIVMKTMLSLLMTLLGNQYI